MVEPAATSSEVSDESLKNESWRDRLAVELTAPDRVGLLHDVAAGLANTGWNVVGADVWTNNGRAACILHITDDERQRQEEEVEDRLGLGLGENGFQTGAISPVFERESASPVSGSPETEGSPGKLYTAAFTPVDGAPIKKVRSRNSLLADSLQAGHHSGGFTGRSNSAGSLLAPKAADKAVAGRSGQKKPSQGDVVKLRSLVSEAAGKGASVRVCSIGEGAPAGGTETERRLHRLLTVDTEAGDGAPKQMNGGAREGGVGLASVRENGVLGLDGAGGSPSVAGATGKGEKEGYAAEITVRNSDELRYTIVCIRCVDRPKLLFDALCVITDMTYVIHHASVESEDGMASQVGLQTLKLASRRRIGFSYPACSTACA